MATDIRLDEDGGQRLVLQGQVVQVESERILLQSTTVDVSGRLNLRAVESGNRTLPTEARIGDLFLMIESREVLGGIHVNNTSLWLCVPPSSPSREGGPATWRQIQLGDEVVGP